MRPIKKGLPWTAVGPYINSSSYLESLLLSVQLISNGSSFKLLLIIKLEPMLISFKTINNDSNLRTAFDIFEPINSCPPHVVWLSSKKTLKSPPRGLLTAALYVDLLHHHRRRSPPLSCSALGTSATILRCTRFPSSSPPPSVSSIIYSVSFRMWLLGMWLLLLRMWMLGCLGIESKPMKWYFTWLLFKWKWIQSDCLKMNTMWLPRWSGYVKYYV
jgi:hypothetical protein